MIRGLYTSGLGMITQMKKMDVVSNNLANSATTGYKRDITVTTTFPDMFSKRLDDSRHEYVVNKHAQNIGSMSMGVGISKVFTDYTQGSLLQTGDPYNVAISGSGFFAVNVTDANGAATERYTRDGSLTVSNDRILVTTDGQPVVGTRNQTITIPDGEISIDGQGRITSNGVYVDTIKMIDFEDTESLQYYGNNYVSRTNASVERAFTGSVVQGYLENSNANTVKEMVEMIATQRAYEANAKMVQTHDTTLGRAVTEIARR